MQRQLIVCAFQCWCFVCNVEAQKCHHWGTGQHMFSSCCTHFFVYSLLIALEDSDKLNQSRACSKDCCKTCTVGVLAGEKPFHHCNAHDGHSYYFGMKAARQQFTHQGQPTAAMERGEGRHQIVTGGLARCVHTAACKARAVGNICALHVNMLFPTPRISACPRWLLPCLPLRVYQLEVPSPHQQPSTLCCSIKNKVSLLCMENDLNSGLTKSCIALGIHLWCFCYAHHAHGTSLDWCKDCLTLLQSPQSLRLRLQRGRMARARQCRLPTPRLIIGPKQVSCTLFSFCQRGPT